jgi:DNA-binding GntR family transcriptional regulator
MAEIARLDRVNVRDQVGRALRAAIINGEMEPGVVYSAPSLGARFGVSATPVREAMLDLVREGLVEIAPNKGFRVTVIGERDLDEITELRLLLEPPVARKALPRIAPADVDELRDLATDVVRRAEAGDLIAYTEADRVFHLRLLGFAGNERLLTLVSDLRAHTRLFGLADLRERGELVDAAAEHLAIVDAIGALDAERVETLTREHISKTRGTWAKPAKRPQ